MTKQSVRTTITMSRKLHKECREFMETLGYGNKFSKFIADAARRQKRRLSREKPGL